MNFLDNLDWSVIPSNADLLWSGVQLTVVLTFVTMILSIIFGTVLAVLRVCGYRVLSWPSAFVVNFFRSVPLLLLLFWVFYVLPATTDIRLSPFLAALVGLSACGSAYVAEVIRAGILSIRKGQREAALALGMTRSKAFLRITMPQAVRRVIPPLATIWVSLFKDTSLVSTIGVADLSHAALSVRAQTFRVFEILTALAVIYLLLAYPQAKLTDWLHRRLRVEE
ncbi:amino acid ABC transporter permease [Nocardioides daeguensis]|uniref:Amino acid ABC transporter permease n=1 Tax=Nocardioides daeguensis TaxID=908359 RepID=A0ABP6W9L2_9ACTN|nr:amino acid ABC transporter permease [Nocardioides daeguensis]MBV6729815.1 amino acid ABC transporter permease [Nocardioides daeguensis]MCR1775386.1 amino acid ABC transporter permease [Nocardioides daeguensis]